MRRWFESSGRHESGSIWYTEPSEGMHMPYRDPEKQKAYQAKHYKDNAHHWRDKSRRDRARKREIFARWRSENPCVVCGESDPVVIDAHHTDPSTKHDRIANLITMRRSDKVIVEELKKCVGMCANCHRRHHAAERPLTIPM